MCHAALATHVKIRMCAFVCGWRTSRGKPGDVQPHVGLRLNVSNINLLKSFFIKKKKTIVVCRLCSVDFWGENVLNIKVFGFYTL